MSSLTKHCVGQRMVIRRLYVYIRLLCTLDDRYLIMGILLAGTHNLSMAHWCEYVCARRGSNSGESFRSSNCADDLTTIPSTYEQDLSEEARAERVSRRRVAEDCITVQQRRTLPPFSGQRENLTCCQHVGAPAGSRRKSLSTR